MSLHQQGYALDTNDLKGTQRQETMLALLVLFLCNEQQLVTDLAVIEMASHALQNDGAVLEGGPNFAEAQPESRLDGTQGLQAQLLGIVHGQQRGHQLVQLLFGLLLLYHHSLL